MRTAPTFLALAALSVLATLCGCQGSYPLHSNLEDSEIRARLSEKIPPGTPEDSVRSTLIALRVPEGVMMRYPTTGYRPEVLLARLYPPGGFWIDGTTDSVEFVDVSFVFNPSLKLEQTLLHRDTIRYFQGEAVKGPVRELMARVPRYPGMPPPPVNPLEDAH